MLRGNGEAQRVRLRFSPAAARYVREKQWHPSQQIQERKGGGLILTLQVAHFQEVKSWALGWGSECEVLAPKELRRELSEELRRMLERYR